jgi:hypothetical protein
MTTPNLTLTMLGTTSSGKTTFLLGMYDILAAGLHGYFTFTEDPDQAVDLRDAWDLLIDEGELPRPNVTDDSKHYRFVFSHGFTPLVTIDWMDYRGGALDDRRDSGSDVLELRGRLERSDSIYLVLDGGSLAIWLDNPEKRTVVQKKLKVQAMSSQVLHALTNRKRNGLPLPSLAVLITKADLLRGPDRSVGQALAAVVDGLPELLPVVWADGVTALICPVKVGDFGANSTGIVNVSTIDPVGLHRPMIFSLMHYLSEGLDKRKDVLVTATASHSEAEQQIAALSRGYKAYFRGHRVAQWQQIADSYGQAIADERRQYRSDQDLVAQLSQELLGQPVIRNGKLEL